MKLRVASLLLGIFVFFSYAPFAKPSEDKSYLGIVWELGTKLSLCALAHAQGARADLVERYYNDCRHDASLIGVELAPLPKLSGNKASDIAEALNYILERAGKPIGDAISSRYGNTSASLFELAIKAPTAIILYSPSQDSLSTTLIDVIESRAKASGLPENLWQPFVDKMRSSASEDDIKDEVFSMIAKVGDYLKQNNSLSQNKNEQSTSKVDKMGETASANQPIAAAARNKLKQNGIDFTKEAFVLRAIKGDAATVKLFLDGGMDPNSILTDERRSDFPTGYIYGEITALMGASSEGHVAIVRMLLERGAEVNEKGDDGKTALMYAAAKGQSAVVKLLLDKGAEPNEEGRYGVTALSVAIENGYAEVVRILIDKGLDINAKDKNDRTALMIAVEKNRPEIVRLLLDKGADPNIKSEKYISALAIATMEGYGEIAKILQDRGVKLTEEDLRNIRVKSRKDNEASAIEAMRLFHSTEVTYKFGIGNGKFGSAIDLFYQDFIDEKLADAAGVPAITSSGGQHCPGTKTPKRGYIFRLTYTDNTFKAVAIPALTTGEARTGDRTFYNDESGVIRVSNSPTVMADANSDPLNY